MTMTNQELARRADVALADLNANGGLLSPEQTNVFIDRVQEQPTLLRQARLVRMNGPERKVNKIGFDTRILRAARTSGGDNDDGSNDRYVAKADRAKPTTSQIQLNTKEVIAEVRLPYEVLEDNIEGMSFEDHVMTLIAERAALDLEELAIHGDTASSDAYLALQDGYLKRITSHVVDNAAAGVSADLFEAGLLAMPQRYLRNMNLMRHYISMANTIRYRGKTAKRETGYGDSILTGNQPLMAYGVPVEGVASLATHGSGKAGILTMPQNLIFGVQRQIQVETDKDIRSREIIIVLTARVAIQIEDEAAAVRYNNI